MYRIEQIQRVPISREEAWKFFSNPKNLEAVTPDDIGFSFQDQLAERMYKGMVIRYTVAPLFGIKLKWATEITAIMEYDYFVDHQLSGPYKIWHHQHFFKTIEGGTELKDIVHYELPLGFVGKIAHALLVKRKLKQIFAHRKNSIEATFGTLR
jgi:ligand-binding SRPBCC domain-containing protein